MVDEFKSPCCMSNTYKKCTRIEMRMVEKDRYSSDVTVIREDGEGVAPSRLTSF